MSEPGDDAPARQAPAARLRNPYRGRPENQRNPRAENIWKGPPRVPREQQPPKLTPRNAPKALPKPTQLHDTSHVKLTEVCPTDGSVFATGMSVREVSPRLTFSPAAPALIDISRQCYAELITDEPNLTKTILPEYVDYYNTALLWMRIVTLKQKNSQALTVEENDLLTLIQTTAFVVVEPILLQLRQLGNVVSTTRQHLYPQFPPLPTGIIADHGGYYGPLLPPGEDIDLTVHNLYEELPCLGVLSESIRATISNSPPGPYRSNVTYQELQPNQNLLGFRALGSRRSEPKNLAFDCRITEADFPSYPPNTEFNFEFLVAMSNVLANTKTFKNTEVVFSTLTEVGAQSQLVVSHPLPTPGTNCLRGEQVVTSLSQDSLAILGAAVFFDSQLMKEDGPGANPTDAWCLFRPTPQVRIPEEWIDNRNVRRDLPIQYQQRVFTSVSQLASTFRINSIKTLVLTKR